MAESVSCPKETGCAKMFEQRDMNGLKLVYDIFKYDHQALQHILHKMNPYIAARGNSIVTDKNNAQDPFLFTAKLLEFRAEIDELIETSFANDKVI